MIVGGLGGFDRGLGGKFALRDTIQAVGLAGEVDVIGNVWALANEFVRLDDEAGDVPAEYLNGDIADESGSDGSGEPAETRRGENVE